MEIMVRASVVFLFLWFVMRILGKRELASLTAFELVLLMVMGDMVQQGITTEDFSVTGAMLAVGTIAVWVLAFSYIGYRWRRSRAVIEGIPVLIARNGKLIPERLELERITPDEVMDAAREQGIGDFSKVSVALLEASGKFSFITGERHDQPEDIAV